MSDGHRWQLDQSRNAYYYIDHERRLFVYRDGSQVPFAPREPREQPRTASLPQSLPPPATDGFRPPAQRPNYVHGAADTQPGVSNPEQTRLGQGSQSTETARRGSHSVVINLAANMGGLSIASSGQRPQQRTDSIPVQVSQNAQHGIRTVEIRDPGNLVETRFATPLQGRSEGITDPVLFRRGIHAERMLYGTGREGDTEHLFSGFKVRPRSFFRVGRVFLVLWVEPAGENATMITSRVRNDRAPDPSLGTGRFGEHIFSKVRRFVVIRESGHFCSALPIASYHRQGVAKPGIIKHEHGIIFSGKNPPEPRENELPLRGEQGMRSRAIRIIADDPTDTLDIMSRIDYAKISSVQYNIKCKPLGQVHQKSIEALQSQFANCWTNTTTAIEPPTAGPSRGGRPSTGAPPGRKPVAPDDGDDTASESDGDRKRGRAARARSVSSASGLSKQQLQARQVLVRQQEEDRAARATFDEYGRKGLNAEQAFERMVREWINGGWTREAAATTLSAHLSRTQRTIRPRPPRPASRQAQAGNVNNVVSDEEDENQDEDDEDDEEKGKQRKDADR